MILLLPRVIDIPSTVKAASAAATTWVALSESEATSPGLYFNTLFSVLLRKDLTRKDWLAPSTDFTINE